MSRRAEAVPGTLPPHVAESWRRCRGLGLQADLRPCMEPLPDPQVRLLLERDHQLASVAQSELGTLSQAIADTGHVVLLIDDQGYVVAAGGDVANSGAVLRRARRGVDLRESNFGTTAPGTALVERRPVVVRREEHFLSGLRHMECLAAPIFQPRGELLGVLDVSSETRALLPGLMDLVHASVLRIERRLLRALRSPAILRVHPHPQLLGSVFEGLIALGADGEVLGLNSLAVRLLSVPASQALARPVSELFDIDPLRHRPAGGAPLRLRVPGGMSLFATLVKTPELTTRHKSASSRALAMVPVPGCSWTEPLTRRETTILRYLDSDFGNREIAAALFIAESTLKWHLHNVFGKLGVRNRSGALKKARALGLLPTEG